MKSFLKAKDTYLKNAIVQNDMREVLLSEISGRFCRVLELGSNRGEFSKMVAKKIEFSEFYCVDINDFSLDYGKEFIFVKQDLRDFENSFLAKMDFDLIISNACFQWLDLAKLIEKIHEINSTLVFSTFGVDNLWQIKEHFGVGLEYLSVEQIKQILKPYYQNIKIYEKTYELEFDTSLKLFRHLKLSGVNAFGGVFLGKNDLRVFADKYQNTLNYHAIFVRASNEIL